MQLKIIMIVKTEHIADNLSPEDEQRTARKQGFLALDVFISLKTSCANKI